MLRFLFIAAIVVAGPAFATAEYPGEIRSALGTAELPPGSCAVCHFNSNFSRAGVMGTPFGRSMLANGLTGNSTSSLRAALTALEMANTDSDSDGCTDIAELKATPATNPNTRDCSMGGVDGGAGGGEAGGAGGSGGSGGGAEIGPLRYGCGANIAPGLVGLGALLVLARRRNR
ncbi:MAG: hypothetical protein MUC96_32135 [Myxococcaceae bacterium]|jgi:hypothetical protein|nr:hypothetical protein [Myxococcaceae bacterium]